jgi:hypothetical protein
MINAHILYPVLIEKILQLLNRHRLPSYMFVLAAPYRRRLRPPRAYWTLTVVKRGYAASLPGAHSFDAAVLLT